MGKVFRYELRRMVRSKIFVGLLAVLLWYAWQILNNETIQGVAHSAPFSPWSFGSYLCGLLPLLSLALMFFLWEISSGRARRVELLTDATQTEHRSLLLVRGCAAATAWLLLTLAVVLLGLGFLLHLFGGDVPLGELLVAAALAPLPSLLFLLGLGLLVGRMRPGLVFLLLPVIVLFVLLPLPMAAQLFPNTFFTDWPLGLALDPALTAPLPFLAGRLLYSIAGLCLLALNGTWVGTKGGLDRQH